MARCRFKFWPGVFFTTDAAEAEQPGVGSVCNARPHIALLYPTYGDVAMCGQHATHVIEHWDHEAHGDAPTWRVLTEAEALA